jgi:molybdopterin-guanine dinucleotide biosynthesis protein A
MRPQTIAKSDLTLAILAGGGGKRLGGKAKGLLTAGGVPFIQRVLALQSLCAEAIIVSADPAYDRFGVRRVEDVEPGRGAPGGVVTALLSVRTPWVLVAACDMPFVTLDAARALIAAAGDEDITCFVRDGALEPLLGVYRSSLGAAWRARLGENPALRALLNERSLRTLDPADASSLDSINTPEQLALVKS